MSRGDTPFGGEPAIAIPLVAIAAAALAFGLYGRFAGLGLWPFGVDEFYLSRSVDHVLASGLPRFPCGGYYTRGLLFQYLVAALRLEGAGPEFSARVLAALFGLAALPAAFAVARRIEGATAAWLTVAILCASVWEIEMARFGRMYAPFQAVFCWYVVCYLRYTVDGRASAFGWMLALSLLGVLTWEGGTLLGLASLLAVIQTRGPRRLERGDWLRLAAGLAVLALLYAASRDLRGPAGVIGADTPEVDAGPHGVGALRAALAAHAGWAFAFLVPLLLSLPSLRYALSLRQRPFAAAGICAVLAAAIAHAFIAVTGLLVLMLLAGLIDVAELRAPRARPLWIAIAALALFWGAFELGSGGSPRALVNLPDVFGRIAWPWARTMPVMTLLLGLAGLYWLNRCLRVPGRPSGVEPVAPASAVRPLLALTLLLLLAVGAIPTERIETRYTFFLYPLLVALGVAAVLALAARGGVRTRAATLAAIALTAAGFAAGGDLQIRHVAHIASAQANYRLGLPPARADHYYPRNDIRGIAGWLHAHVRPGDVVLSGIPNLDPYYPDFDFFYLDAEDNRYDAYVCADGRTDRWTNHPILYGPGPLESRLGSGHAVYATVYGDTEQRLMQAARQRGWTLTRVYTAIDGKSDVLRIDAAAR